MTTESKQTDQVSNVWYNDVGSILFSKPYSVPPLLYVVEPDIVWMSKVTESVIQFTQFLAFLA
jgi:hypothetical protein